MPFTETQSLQRRAAVAAANAADAAEREAEISRQNEDEVLKAMLRTNYPKIDLDTAYELWKIAMIATNTIIHQYVQGETCLEYIDVVNRTFFYSSSPQETGNADVLLEMMTRMAKQCSDVGQSFRLEQMFDHEWQMGYQQPQVRVICEALLPA